MKLMGVVQILSGFGGGGWLLWGGGGSYLLGHSYGGGPGGQFAAITTHRHAHAQDPRAHIQ